MPLYYKQSICDNQHNLERTKKPNQLFISIGHFTESNKRVAQLESRLWTTDIAGSSNM